MSELLLKTVHDGSYFIRALNKEEAIEINEGLIKIHNKEKYEFKILNYLNDENIELIAGGNTCYISTSLLEQIIPIERIHIKYKEYYLNNVFTISHKVKHEVKEYKCFCNIPVEKRNKNNNVIIHEDLQSSFKCALDFIGRPQNALIIKRKNGN